ncbi:hypothetical protein CI109_107119 [Kwoniella shandongensis]|uniref:Uncharacterized protein n=1 Tax=Kwoniella shandongensis TaxID=1734106 RepID=A0A5M6C2V8_9TREE|nr:uncharacterized protein CI109_002402 [Kwoniella shandongensis]KAA5529061.1 hypothetical protein CI109_002402 [Kwoniella shandongensis]
MRSSPLSSIILTLIAGFLLLTPFTSYAAPLQARKDIEPIVVGVYEWVDKYDFAGEFNQMCDRIFPDDEKTARPTNVERFVMATDHIGSDRRYNATVSCLYHRSDKDYHQIAAHVARDLGAKVY